MNEQRKAVIRRFYAELDRHNFDIYRELCTPDYVSHFPGAPGPQDRAARAAISREFYAAVPDLTHIIADIIAEGDRVAFRGAARGTFTRPFRGIAPTGKTIEFTLMRYYRMEGLQIAEEWANADRLGLLGQMGGLK